MAEIEQQLRGRAHNTAIAALEVVPFAMLITDADAQALAVNGKWMELAGITRANSLGPGWLSVLDPDNRSRLREDVLRVAREGTALTVDYEVSRTPAKRWTRWWISRHELEGLPLVAIGAADVDEDYARQANLYHLATHDSLTGLINRSHFLECIDQALRRSRRQSRHLAVVYVDLDGFKRVNDQGGHSLGDRVLYAIAYRLRNAVRAADMVARIGGDEFAVLCEGLSAAEQADVVAERIATALTESVELDGESWSVAASVGAAVDREPDSAEELVDRADRAMYTVKLTRRGSARRAEDVLQEAPEMAVAALRPERRTDADPRPPLGYPERRADRQATGAYERHGPEGGAAGAPAGPAGAAGVAGAAAGVPAGSSGAAGAAAGVPAGPSGSSGAAGAAAGVPAGPAGATGVGLLEVDDGARQALQELAKARRSTTGLGEMTGPGEPGIGSGVESGGGSLAESGGGSLAGNQFRGGDQSEIDSPRHRLATDVVNLRESIDSIRDMLDRLLATDSDIIDIREHPDS